MLQRRVFDMDNKEMLKQIADAAEAVPAPGFGVVSSAMVNLMAGTLNQADFQEVVSTAKIEDAVSKSSVTESKGFIVTKDDLWKIFTYVDEALALPTDVTAAETYLGYKGSDEFFKDEAHAFLKPENQVEFDKPIVEHASQWAGIEHEIKALGNTLNGYAKEFVIQAGDVIEILEDLNKYMKVTGFLDEDGKEIIAAGCETLDSWKKGTQVHKAEAEALKARLMEFDYTLENKIKAKVDTRKEEISRMNMAAEVEKLNSQVNTLKEEIKKLDDEYDECVGLAFTGAAGMICPPLGIISWAITGGIYGAKAEKLRKLKNTKKDELAPLQKQLEADNRVISGIQKLDSMLTDFKAAIVAAIVGVQHVNLVWDSIVQDIGAAQDHLNNIENPEYVKRVRNLKTEIEIAKERWNSCGDLTKELVALFDMARKEYNEMKANTI